MKKRKLYKFDNSDREYVSAWHYIRSLKQIECTLNLWQQIKNDYIMLNMNIRNITLIHKKCGNKVTFSLRNFNKRIKRNKNICGSKMCEIDKLKNTNLKVFSEEYQISSESTRNKSKSTMIEKYGTDNTSNIPIIVEKRNNTNLQRYGHISNLHGINDIKVKQTIFKKYGVYNSFQIPEVRAKAISKESMKKKYETHKKNNSFHASKQEEIYFEWLKNTYTDAKRHYKDIRYPFVCDFYVPSLDLFIELNLHWTHGNEPYDINNPKHQEIVEMWRSKNTKFYNNAIETWTIRDVNKRTIAENNDISFIEIFKININLFRNINNG